MKKTLIETLVLIALVVLVALAVTATVGAAVYDGGGGGYVCDAAHVGTRNPSGQWCVATALPSWPYVGYYWS